jgi:hypothetical protein
VNRARTPDFGGPMNVLTKRPVEIALRTLKDDERQTIHAWFDQLKNWDNDPHVRGISRQLPYKDVFVLTTSDGMRIFFNKGENTITILDLATKATIDQFADAE